jgi:hypothetical protein
MTKPLKIEFMLSIIQGIYDAEPRAFDGERPAFTEAVKCLHKSCRVFDTVARIFLLDTAVHDDENKPVYLLNKNPNPAEEKIIKTNIKKVMKAWAFINESLREKDKESMRIIYRSMAILDEIVDKLDGTEVWTVQDGLQLTIGGPAIPETGPFTYISETEKWYLMSMKVAELYNQLKRMPIVQEYVKRRRQREHEILESDDFFENILLLGARVCYKKHGQFYVGRRSVSESELPDVNTLVNNSINYFNACSSAFRQSQENKNILPALLFLKNIAKIDDGKEWILQSKDGFALNMVRAEHDVNPRMYPPVSPNPEILHHPYRFGNNPAQQQHLSEQVDAMLRQLQNFI